MVICGQCGERNPDDAQFCGVCNTYLEWDGDHADQRPPVPVVPPAPQPIGQLATQPTTQPLQPTTQPLQPVAMQPSDEVTGHRRHALPSQPEPPAPGDLICGQCGTGNAPTRRFCRRCAALLAEAPVLREPWWRRFIPKRAARTPRTGERPRRRRSRAALGGMGRGIRWGLAILLVLAGLSYGLVPTVRNWVNPELSTAWRKAQSVFRPVYIPVRPIQVASNGELPDHPAIAASDGVIDTYWAVAEGAPEPTLIFTFERPVNLKRAIVRSGASNNFHATHRPQLLHLVFSTGQTADLTLADTPDEQTLGLPGSQGATTVEIHVVSLYHAVSGPNLAITEIELFEQQS